MDRWFSLPITRPLHLTKAPCLMCTKTGSRLKLRTKTSFSRTAVDSTRLFRQRSGNAQWDEFCIHLTVSCVQSVRCSPVAAVKASILYSLCRWIPGRHAFEAQHCHAGLGVAISNHRTEPLISILPSLNNNAAHISIFSFWIWTKLSHLIAVATLFIRSFTAMLPSYLQTGLFVIQEQANWFFFHI